MSLNFEFDEGAITTAEDMRVPLSTDFLVYDEEDRTLDAEAYPAAAGFEMKRRWFCFNGERRGGHRLCSGIRDPFFAVIFLLHACVILWLAAFKGFPAVIRGRDGWAEVGLDPVDGEEIWRDGRGARTGAGSVELVLLMVIPVTVALAALWVKVLLWLGGALGRVLFLVAGVALGAVGSVALWAGFSWLGALLWAGAVCSMCVACLGICGWGTTRVELAGTNLKVACMAVTSSPSTFTAAVLVLLLQGVWGVVWGLAAVGTAAQYGSGLSLSEGGTYFAKELCETQETEGPTDIFGGCYLPGVCVRCVCDGVVLFPDKGCAPEPKVGVVAVVFLVLSLTWGCTVLANVVQCLSAGAVGAWWFKRDEGAVVFRSLEQALTTSFGTICLASLLSAAAAGIRGFLGAIRRRRRHTSLFPAWFILGIVTRAVAAIESALAFFNRYTLCHAAIFGGGYWTSGAEASDVLSRRGWTAVTGDILLDCALFLGCTSVASLSGVAGYLVAGSRGLGLSGSEAVAAAVAAALLGGFMCSAAGRLVTSALAATIILFAKDPDALSLSHHEAYTELREAYIGFGYNV